MLFASITPPWWKKIGAANMGGINFCPSTCIWIHLSVILFLTVTNVDVFVFFNHFERLILVRYRFSFVFKRGSAENCATISSSSASTSVPPRITNSDSALNCVLQIPFCTGLGTWTHSTISTNVSVVPMGYLNPWAIVGLHDLRVL